MNSLFLLKNRCMLDIPYTICMQSILFTNSIMQSLSTYRNDTVNCDFMFPVVPAQGLLL